MDNSQAKPSRKEELLNEYVLKKEIQILKLKNAILKSKKQYLKMKLFEMKMKYDAYECNEQKMQKKGLENKITKCKNRKRKMTDSCTKEIQENKENEEIEVTGHYKNNQRY